MKWLSAVVAAVAVGVSCAAETTYTLGSPRPAALRDTPDAAQNEWLASNDVFVATAGFATFTGAISDLTHPDGEQYSLASGEGGFAWERSKPEYYLSDRIDAPEDVDWYATYDLWETAQRKGSTGFLFNPAQKDPCVYAITGGSQTFDWVLKDGSTNTMTYVVAMSCAGRPKRIFWTDAPWNGPTVSLDGKFVRFMGNSELLTLRYGVETNLTGGISMVTSNKVVSGLYVDPDAHVLYAAGQMNGQCVMVYYDTGSYEKILSVQVVEVREPEVINMSAEIGTPIQPDGQGYGITGFTANVQSGLTDPGDNRGPYLYQHKGMYSYSAKNGAVFPLRPTTGSPWLASVYWMEQDDMGVSWPFELDHYNIDWPNDATVFVRGDVDGNAGLPVYIPKDYTATLCDFQEPSDHAVAVTGNNAFSTTGSGMSLLKLCADDNIWFLPIHSVLRSDTNYFTLASARIPVGHEFRIRAGARSGVAGNHFFAATEEVPGYVYPPVSGSLYDANLYRERTSADMDSITSATNMTADSSASTNTLPSAIYAIAEGASGSETIEVWWSKRFQKDDMPYAIDIPVLPQVYRPAWPDIDEAPQIVIASQSGSANEMIFAQHGAARLDCSGNNISGLALANRRYFPSGSGTVSFWTRPTDDPADGTNRSRNCNLLALDVDSDDYDTAALAISVKTNDHLAVSIGGAVAIDAPMPSKEATNDWTHVAVAFNAQGTVTLYLDGSIGGTANCGEEAIARLAEYLDGNVMGEDADDDEGLDADQGREVAEITFRSIALSEAEISGTMHESLDGGEANVTGYYSFREGEDLVAKFQSSVIDLRTFRDRVHGEDCIALNVLLNIPGPPLRGTGVIQSDSTPSLYYENDSSKVGYNPNEEHAFIRSGSGGYVAWALRTDLNTDKSSRPGVFVEYERDGKAKLQFFHVLLTNGTWTALADVCTAGAALPGPHPLDMFDDPWLPETYWEAVTNETSVGAGYRDRKGQVWARSAGTLPMHMYYAMQDGFWFPQLSTNDQPAVGAAIPWLSLLGHESEVDADPVKLPPAAWTWTVEWPSAVPEMKIGQTLTVAENSLPEVWNAKSMSVVFPDPEDTQKVVTLTDPTVMQSVPFAYTNLTALGLSTDNNGGLAYKGGKYYFTDLPPHLSSRLYLDTTNDKLCFIGERESSAAGVSVLYPNVLSAQERSKVLALVSSDNARYAMWEDAVNSLATSPVVPNEMSRQDSEVFTKYSAVDHYALSALGGTNYVVLIENDATNRTMGVTDGDPISMHVLKVVPEYYTGRIVTREDEINLLSQQLSVLYTEAFAGDADDFVFEWRKASPNADGTIPDDYDNTDIYRRKYDPDASVDEARGNVRITVGEQGDTLANMVNAYWICRYRARNSSVPAWSVMGDRWSAWCAPPALAEGWVQRVLNNITPFNQRMTDLYNNAAETAVSMLQQAGAPYKGDVALNQDNLTSVGLIQLYETILNKAESLSLSLGINDTDANKQLLLAVERLQDLYTVLGDEAYTDAKNPTIGFGSNKAVGGGTTTEVDYSSESSSLFCFDNQVSSLLDEELALLRGRTGESAPSTKLFPYYNRLVWNFTKGITAGEVAYAVNYNIEGTETVALSEEQAAILYPQGHGDAYGHYLSALKGWYRLMRNPCFSWPVAQGEMVVADSTVNVDYYEEAKFATAAANLAKVAAEVTDLTARKAWRDNGGNAGTGYLDEKGDRAFGYGEWASRGGYGALVNWAVANSLLPVDATTLDDDAFDEAFSDGALTRIDRGTVDELAEICDHANAIQRTEDMLDIGLNPLGLADNAIPFDITPIGAADGTKTHFEQIRERAGTALANARAVLDRAQAQANRLRMIQEANDSYSDSIAAEEAAYTKQLIGYYGTPYSDDIGPGKTYVQGYDGPDLIHYAWMDLSRYGLTDIEDTIAVTGVTYSGIGKSATITAVRNKLESGKVESNVAYEMSASGIIVKPSSITGTRTAQGSIQERYADFLMQYIAVKQAMGAYDYAVDAMEAELKYAQTMMGLQGTVFALQEALNAAKMVTAIATCSLKITLNALECLKDLTDATINAPADVTPKITGAGMTVNVDPSAVVEAAAKGLDLANKSAYGAAKLSIQNTLAVFDATISDLEIALSIVQNGVSFGASIHSLVESVKSKVSAVNSAYNTLWTAMAKLNECVDAFNTEVANAETLLAQRETVRKRQVNLISQARYNDMLFRQLKNESLARYQTSFDLAQRYAFLAAQAYDYETALLSTDSAAGDAFKAKIVGSRSLGAFDADGNPIVGGNGDTGLAGLLAQLDANWLVLKPRLGINNPQQYATWFSLRSECFRILPDAAGDAAWAKELAKYRVDDISSDSEFIRHCQPFQSQFGVAANEPGLIIPFETTIDFAKNLFGNDLAGGDSSYDSTWYATRIAAAGLWFDGYNGKTNGYAGAAQLSSTPVAYLVPVGFDCMRVPGLDDGTVMRFDVSDQVIAAPYAIGATHLDDVSWFPSASQGDLAGADTTARIRRHPSFRAYFSAAGGAPVDSALDCTRLVGRSVWNTRWLLVIPAGGMNADRDKALSIFVNGSDQDRDGRLDLTPVRDIRIGFRTYSNSGN